MIPTGHTKALDNPLAALDLIVAQVCRAADYDDPRVTSVAATKSPNPHESTPPGQEQSKRLIADVSAVLNRTARDLKTLCDNAHVCDRQDAPHESIGNVDVVAPDNIGSCYRPHKPVRIDMDGAMRHMKKLTANTSGLRVGDSD